MIIIQPKFKKKQKKKQQYTFQHRSCPVITSQSRYFKIIYAAPCVMIYFKIYKAFPTDEWLSLFYRYLDRMCLDELHSLFPSVLTFTAVTHILANHTHSLRISEILVQLQQFHPTNYYFVEPPPKRLNLLKSRNNSYFPNVFS